MTGNIHQMHGQRPEKSGSVSRPASPAELTSQLTACLALVRPVGMGDTEAADWLGAAATSLAQVPIDLFNRACITARRTCKHHSAIVPTIAAQIETERAEANRLAEWTKPIALPAPSKGIGQAEFEKLVAERGRGLSAALDRGLILSDGNGNFRLPDAA